MFMGMKTLTSITDKFFLLALLFVFVPVTLTAQGVGQPFHNEKARASVDHLTYGTAAQPHHFFSTDKRDITFLLEFDLIADAQLIHGMYDRYANSPGYNRPDPGFTTDLKFFNDYWGVSLYKVVTNDWRYPLACSEISRSHFQNRT